MAPSDHWKKREFDFSNRKKLAGYGSDPSDGLFGDGRHVFDLVDEIRQAEDRFLGPRSHELFMDAWGAPRGDATPAPKSNPDRALIDEFLAKNTRKQRILLDGHVVGFRYVK